MAEVSDKKEIEKRLGFRIHIVRGERNEMIGEEEDEIRRSWWTSEDTLGEFRRHISLDQKFGGEVKSYMLKREDCQLEDQWDHIPCNGTICYRQGNKVAYIVYSTPTFRGYKPCYGTNGIVLRTAYEKQCNGFWKKINDLPSRIEILIVDSEKLSGNVVWICCQVETGDFCTCKDDISGKIFPYSPRYVVTVDKSKKISSIGDSTCRVCGKSSSFKCSTCKKALYCSTECQRQDWYWHKSDCDLK